MLASFRSLRDLVKAAIVAAAILAPPVTAAYAEDGVTVFAAASLKEVLGEVSEAWKAETGRDTTLSFAGSSALAKQIEQGAPADLFISADLKWMDYLDKAGLVLGESRVDLLGNRLVLVAPKDAATTATIADGFPLADLLAGGHLAMANTDSVPAGGHLAMANTDSVPAGTYGKAALQDLGVWDGVEAKVAQAENVRAALLLVSRAEAPLGIVYETDAKADTGVKIVDRFPESSHPAIVCPAAVLKEAKNAEDAAAFLAYLQGAKAHAIFTAAGFTVLAKTN